MKILQRLLLFVLGAIAFTYTSWQLPSVLAQSPPLALLATPETIVAQGNSTSTIAQQAALNVDISGHLTNIISSYPEQTQERLRTFVTADTLMRSGRSVEAEELYRQVKPETDASTARQIPDPIYSSDELSPESLALWNNAQEAIAVENYELAITELQILVTQEPGFLEAPIRLSELLIEEDREEEAVQLLEQASTLHADEPDIVWAWVEALAEEKDYLEASIAAREFALTHPDASYSAKFAERADKYFSKFKKRQKRRSILGGIGSLLGGILTGDRIPWASQNELVETIQIGRLMFGSESRFGEVAAEQHKQSITLVDDPEINDYVTQLGNEMAGFMGRDFDYEFYVVRDDAINASAFPGGKVFVNTGAIMAAHSKAELAGLMGHEVAHAVLSHGVQSVLRTDFLNQFADEIPFGEVVLGLVGLDYSRRQERQADRLGAWVLSKSSYAADGLRNFMATIAQAEAQQASGGSFIEQALVDIDQALSNLEYFKTHPNPGKRVAYLDELIERNNYNRYALEGVDRHLEIQAKVRSL